MPPFCMFVKTANMKYTILFDKSSEVLIRLVNENIKMGWLPLGGVCVSTTDTVIDGVPVKVFLCYQAMTKG